MHKKNEIMRGFIRCQNNTKNHRGKSWFLGIGINTYRHTFQNLNNARKDVEDILSLLQERYELDQGIMLLDEDANQMNIIDHLQMLDQQMKCDDKLMIYYAGHGYLDARNRGYWIPYDAEKNRLATYVNNATIKDFVTGMQAKHILLISDSCFSGMLVQRGGSSSHHIWNDLEKTCSRWVISSGGKRESVSDGIPGSNSPFAQSILKVLRENQEVGINTGLLFDRIMKLTSFYHNQLPQSGPLHDSGHEGGQYVFRLRENEESMWQQAKTINSIYAYYQYYKAYPTGKYSIHALKAIKLLEEKQAWNNALKKYAISAFLEYQTYYPNGMFIHDAQKNIDTILSNSQVDINGNNNRN